ncbi:MAG: T9SS type A sorting domain-containing protein [Bacteroidales bacterium]|nr:T9SS type A sorting domain-containing protein [Bacteroidales bacterium]
MKTRILRISVSLFLTISCSFLFAPLLAQPFTKKYIMSFHTCGAGCTSFNDHKVNLAESDDGATWTMVPNFTPYKGSVPDLTIRGNKLYIYTPNSVKRYDNATSTWDATTSPVFITDSIGGHVNFVDPSPFVDSSGRIVLVYLNSTGIQMGQDPAGCTTFPCTKYFDSAVEVDGSDGTQFVQSSGHRVIYPLSSGSASDPDIYFDGTKYVLYVSKGNNTLAFQGNSLSSGFTAMPNLNSGILTNQGGIPCGYFDPITNKYWTFIHANVSGNTVIRRGIHSDFSTQVSSFTTVISGTIIGQAASVTTESPGFCTNDFLLSSINDLEANKISIFPNPAKGSISVNLSDLAFSVVDMSIRNSVGQSIIQNHFSLNKQLTVNVSTFKSGVYFMTLNFDREKKITKKLIVQ